MEDAKERLLAAQIRKLLRENLYLHTEVHIPDLGAVMVARRRLYPEENIVLASRPCTYASVARRECLSEIKLYRPAEIRLYKPAEKTQNVTLAVQIRVLLRIPSVYLHADISITGLPVMLFSRSTLYPNDAGGITLAEHARVYKRAMPFKRKYPNEVMLYEPILPIRQSAVKHYAAK